jgi:hypothetical protein
MLLAGSFGLLELLPGFQASIGLVKSVFRGHDGHKEKAHNATDCCDIESRRIRSRNRGYTVFSSGELRPDLTYAKILTAADRLSTKLSK